MSTSTPALTGRLLDSNRFSQLVEMMKFFECGIYKDHLMIELKTLSIIRGGPVFHQRCASAFPFAIIASLHLYRGAWQQVIHRCRYQAPAYHWIQISIADFRYSGKHVTG